MRRGLLVLNCFVDGKQEHESWDSHNCNDQILVPAHESWPMRHYCLLSLFVYFVYIFFHDESLPILVKYSFYLHQMKSLTLPKLSMMACG